MAKLDCNMTAERCGDVIQTVHLGYKLHAKLNTENKVS